MRHFKIGLGLTAMVFALAVSVAPALAAEFTASKTGKTYGKTQEEQSFKLGAFKITCKKAVAKGAVAAGSSSEYATSIRFFKCTTKAKIGVHEIRLATHFLTPLAIEYHASGFVETGSELGEGTEGEAVLAGGEVEVKVNTGVNEGHASRCSIHIPEQTIPMRAEAKPNGEYHAAAYSTILSPHGKNEVLIKNAFKTIKIVYEGEPCEEFGREEGPEADEGYYYGSFPQELRMGSFEYN